MALLFNNILQFFFILGVSQFAQFFNKKNNESHTIFIFFSYLIISVVLYFLLTLNLFSKFILINFLQLIICLGIYLFVKLLLSQDFIKHLNKIILKKNFLLIYIYLFFFVLIILSLFPASDSDSLDYHLGAPQYWLKENSIKAYEYWLHYRLATYGETFNLISILYFNGNFLSLLKCYLFIKIFFYLKNNTKKNEFLLLSLFCPILIYFLYSQKPQLLGFLYIFLSILIFFFNKEKNINFSKRFFIYLFLIYSSALNISFLILALPLQLFFFIKVKKKIDILTIFSLNILLFAPLFYNNYVFYSNILSPFFENFFSLRPKEYVINFANYLKTAQYDFNLANISLMPLRFILPLDLSSLSQVYGFSLIFIFFIKKFEKKLYYLLIILLCSFVMIFITKQLSNRFYFLTYLILTLIYLTSGFHKIKLLNLIIFTQSFVIFIFISIYTFFNVSVIFNEHAKKSFLEKNQNQYYETTWLNNIIINSNYATDIRSKSLLNNNHYSLEFLHYINNDYNFYYELNEFIKKNQINYISLVKSSPIYNKFNNCKKIIAQKKFSYLRRNFLLNKSYITREIFYIQPNKNGCELKKFNSF